MAGNQYFRCSISLVLLIPRCPCLWAIWIILSLGDSEGMILSILRISPSAMYSSALRSKYGLRFWSVLIHLSVCMPSANLIVSSLPFAVSSLILSRTTACSDWTVAMTYFSRWSVPVSGSGCLDKKSVMLVLQRIWIISKLRFCIFRASLSTCGGSLAVGLLNSGSSGLWSVANWNFGVLGRYIWSLVVVNSAASAPLSIWEYLFSVSIKVRLT